MRTTPHERRRPSALASLQSLLHDLPQLLSGRVHLLALELRRALQALALLVSLVLVAAVLLATAWLALWAGIAAALIDAGIARAWVAVIVLLLNAGAAGGALLYARSKTHLLALPATMRRLTVAAAPGTSPASEAAAAHDATLPVGSSTP